jgi:spermidine synthase
MWRYGRYLLFFLSGMSALIYELTWQRQLHLVFGVSTLAASAVLAAYMGGLALGAVLLGRRADRTTNPVRLYALIEGGIGLSALLVPAGFTMITGLYVPLHAWLHPGPWGGTLLRLAMSLLVLIVPTTLLGGTVPVMGRLVLRRRDGTTAAFGLLYGVNTLGAVVGAALTGFVLLRFLGMHASMYLAVAINGAVAVIAWLVSMRRPQEGGVPTLAPANVAQPFAPRAPLSVFACAAGTGATALGLEVVWTRILGVFTSNSAYAFALMLTTVLAGLGSGSLLQAWMSRRRGDPWLWLALCQWLLVAICISTVPGMHTAPAWLDRICNGNSTSAVFLGEAALTAALVLLPAVLLGLGFPLLVDAMLRDSERLARSLGRIYAVNLIACVAGAFAAGFVLIPWLGIQTTLGVFVAIALGVGLLAWGRACRPAVGWRLVVAGAVAAAAIACWLRLPSGGYQKSVPVGKEELLYYKEGNNGTVSVRKDEFDRRGLLVDGQPVAGTGRTIVIDQKMLAHLPLLLHPGPRRALTVGFGSGGTSYSMSLHGIDVDCVEIEKAVSAAAPLFASENHGILDKPRFRLIVDDARSWLRVAPEDYDVIVTDCTNIQYKSNADLYTVEYFALMKKRLAQGGLAAAWVPANGIDPRDLKTLLRSFRQVFPHTSVWFMNTLATDFLIVLGTPGPLEIDLGQLQRRMSLPAVRADLESVGLASPCRLLYTFLGAEADLDQYLGSGPLNTDDRPVLSYSTYAASFRSTVAANLTELLACRSDVARRVLHRADALTMLRHYAASNEALLGHIAHLSGHEADALRHYAEGAKLLPDDPAFRELTFTAYVHAHAEAPAESASSW